MNQRQALAFGRSKCSIFGTGLNWVLSKPWKSTSPNGPTTHVQVGYYNTAQKRLALAVADIALEQMLEGEDVYTREYAYLDMAYAAENPSNVTARKLLSIGMKSAKEYKKDYHNKHEE